VRRRDIGDNRYDGDQDGTGLLQMLDKTEPACVNLGNINKGNVNQFKPVKNTDYALRICNDLDLSISGIDVSPAV
jgi:hypothetical protein